jgi:hypothetical protein
MSRLLTSHEYAGKRSREGSHDYTTNVTSAYGNKWKPTPLSDAEGNCGIFLADVNHEYTRRRTGAGQAAIPGYYWELADYPDAAEVMSRAAM